MPRLIIGLIIIFAFQQTAFAQTEELSLGQIFEWRTSHYGTRLNGRTTANGEVLDKYGLTCAHKTLPFGTMLEVTNPKNGKHVIVRVNDRGPYVRNRKLDISYGAAKEIGLLKHGVQDLDIMVVGFEGEVILTRVYD